MLREDMISVVSEIPPDCGLNSSGALSAALSTAICLSNKYINSETLNMWSKKEKMKDYQNDPHFMNVFRLAWGFDTILQQQSSGCGPYSSLVGSPSTEPLVYLLGLKSPSIYDEDPLYWKKIPIISFWLSRTHHKHCVIFS